MAYRDREHFEPALTLLQKQKWIRREKMEYRGQEGEKISLTERKK